MRVIAIIPQSVTVERLTRMLDLLEGTATVRAADQVEIRTGEERYLMARPFIVEVEE